MRYVAPVTFRRIGRREIERTPPGDSTFADFKRAYRDALAAGDEGRARLIRGAAARVLVRRLEEARS